MTTPRPHPDSPADWEALARYLAGESGPEERNAVRRWLDAHPADAQLLGLVDDAAREARAATLDVDVEGALAKVRARMDAPTVLPLRPRAPATPAQRWRVGAMSGLAAAAVLAAGVALWRGAARTPEGTAARTFATSVGARDSLHLPDGTRVVLAPGSRLDVADGFGARRREVRLHGEAFFEVVHDDARPFVVRAGEARVRDVGTAFTVRGDAARGVEVVVTQGSVAVAHEAARDDEAVLHAGDLAVVATDHRVVVRRGGATPDDTSWMRGRLVYHDAPIAEVRADLRRWYGLELRLTDSSLDARHLTATFEGESADAVLRVIGLALGADVERRGDTAVVRPRAGAAAPAARAAPERPR